MRLECHRYSNITAFSVRVAVLVFVTILNSACHCPECAIRQPSVGNEDSVQQSLLTDKCTAEACGTNGTWLGENVAFRELDLDTQNCDESPYLDSCVRDPWIIGLEQGDRLYRLSVRADKRDELIGIGIGTMSGKTLKEKEL